jgi:DNA-binding transcriptional MerR regulator
MASTPDRRSGSSGAAQRRGGRGDGVARTGAGRQTQLSLDLPVDERRGYRGRVVCSIVGITYRQLDYWARTGLVPPSLRRAEGSGTQRLYAFEDIVRLRVIKRLLDAGVNLERIRIALEELVSQGRALSEVTLASDGSTVYAIDDDLQLLDLLRRGQGVFAIALEPLVNELRGEVDLLPVGTEGAGAGADEASTGTPLEVDTVAVTRIAG